MQSFDVVILGSGQIGNQIARKLSPHNLKIALVTLPTNEDYFQKLVQAVGGMSPIAFPPTTSVHRITAEHSPFFIDDRRLSIDGQEFQFKQAVIAAGCSVKLLTDANASLTPVELFHMQPEPGRLTIWGAGPAGVCTAIKAAALGADVELIVKQGRVLPHEDSQTSEFVLQQLQAQHVQVRLQADSLESRTHVNCTGLSPNSQSLRLKSALIYADPNTGAIKVDELMRTSNPRVYASGAVTGPPFNLNFERFQADLVAENLAASFFMQHRFLPEAFPNIIPFSIPIARIGLTEAEALKKYGREILTITRSIDNGFVKLVALRRSAFLVGAHVAGVGADGLMLFFDLLMRAEIPLRDIIERHHFPSSPLSDAAADAVEAWIETAGR